MHSDHLNVIHNLRCNRIFIRVCCTDFSRLNCIDFVIIFQNFLIFVMIGRIIYKLEGKSGIFINDFIPSGYSYET